MGFLGDVGRSNAGQVSQSIFNDVLKYKQFERQGEQDALSAATQAQQMDIQRKTFAIQEAEAAQKKAEWLDNHTVENVADMRASAEKQGKGATFKVLQEHLSPYVQTAPDGTEFVLRQDRKKVADLMAKDPNIRFRFGAAELEGLQSQYDEASSKFDSLKKKAEENPDATLEEQKTWNAKAMEAKSVMDKIGAAKTQKQNEIMWTHPDLVKEMLKKEGKDAESAKKDLLAERKQDLAERKQDSAEAAMDRRLSLMERVAASKSGGPDRKDLSFGDKETLRALGKQLPKTKTAAEIAVKNVQKIDRMLGLIDQGAGGVRGEILAKVNKVADALRVTPPEDAKYNTLKAELRGFAGQLRLQLGLIGQTSDRDVAIMYESAGGNSPAESQKAILSGYRQGYMQDINTYNSDASAYGEYSEAAKKTYRTIEAPATQVGKASASPSKPDWLKAAKAKNPGSSDAELGAYYDKKYGGK